MVAIYPISRLRPIMLTTVWMNVSSPKAANTSALFHMTSTGPDMEVWFRPKVQCMSQDSQKSAFKHCLIAGMTMSLHWNLYLDWEQWEIKLLPCYYICHNRYLQRYLIPYACVIFFSKSESIEIDCVISVCIPGSCFLKDQKNQEVYTLRAVSGVLRCEGMTWNKFLFVGHTGGLTNPCPWCGRCRAGYSNTGGPPLPRKRAPFQKKFLFSVRKTIFFFFSLQEAQSSGVISSFSEE